MQPSFQKHVLVGDRLFNLWIRRSPCFDFHLHYHDEYELTLIRRGHGTRIVGEQIVAYAPGDLVLLGPNLPHTWSSEASPAPASPPREDEHEAVVFQFRRELIAPAWLAQPEWKPLAQMLDRSRRGIAITGKPARELGQRLGRLVGTEDAVLHLKLIELLLVLSRTRGTVALNPYPCEAAPQAGPHRQLDQIYSYLHEHFAENLRLEDVARRFHMSPSTFTRFLKKSTLKTLIEILNELRISHACAKLAQSEQSITEICYAAGFNDLSYFYRKFQAIKGMTPKDYRAHFQQADAAHAGSR